MMVDSGLIMCALNFLVRPPSCALEDVVQGQHGSQKLQKHWLCAVLLLFMFYACRVYGWKIWASRVLTVPFGVLAQKQRLCSFAKEFEHREGPLSRANPGLAAIKLWPTNG